MRVVTHVVVASLCFWLSCGLSAVERASAQPAGTAPAPEAPAKEVALTQKQIDGLLAAHKEIAAIEAKIPESAQGAPGPKVMAQLDGVAKKFGFAGYDDYADAGATVSMVLGGFDYETKKFIGPAAVLKKQIAELQADKSMPPGEKKQALAELNDSLQAASSAKLMPANIDLVGKNFDKLSELFQQDE